MPPRVRLVCQGNLIHATIFGMEETAPLTLRRAWTEVIQAADYELHMANVGQAQANAVLVRDLILAENLYPSGRLLFAGCGPGQFLALVPTDYLENHRCVFTDISPSFVEQTSRRAHDLGLQFEARVDDLESSLLEPGFSDITLVLVLEHTDWKRVLEEMIRLQPQRLFIVVQENPAEMATMVTPHRELPGTLKACANGEKPHLINRDELQAFLTKRGFELASTQVRPVADGKTMWGMVFERRAL